MENLISIYQTRLNLFQANFLRIDHHDAMTDTVYKVIDTSGKEYILKICSRTNDYLREIYFLKHFVNRLPIPRLVQIVESEEGIAPAILMECLPGALLDPHNYTDTLAYEIGETLARIHLDPVKGFGDPIQPHDLNHDPRIPFSFKFEEGLNECLNHLPNVMIEQCRKLYEDRLDSLTLTDGPCIIHRDFRPGNLIIDNGKLQGVIDWSSARAGFAEEDFCSMEHNEWPHSSSKKKAFLSGYASIRQVPDYKVIMPLLRLNKAIGIIGFTVKRGTWNSSQSALYQHNYHFFETFIKNSI